MHRRRLLRGMGAAGLTGIAVPGGGCSTLGGADRPLNGSTEGPYLLRAQEPELVYVRWTLTGEPEEWPTVTVGPRTVEGFRSGYSHGEEEPQPYDQLVREDGRLKVYRGGLVLKSSLEDDQRTVQNVILGRQSRMEQGTTYRLQLVDPESEETYTLSRVTYRGSPEVTTPGR